MFYFQSFCVATIALTLSSLHAAAFTIPQQDANATALSSSMTARDGHPSMIYTNPAALATMDHWQIAVGTEGYQPSVSFEGNNISDRTANRQFLIPNAFLNGSVAPNISLGLGVYAPFGLGTKWDDDWTGRYIATKSDLSVMCIHGGTAVRYGDFRFGAGLRYFRSQAEIDRKVDAGLALHQASGGLTPKGWIADPDRDSIFSMKGDADAFGFNAGTQWDVCKSVTLGLTYANEVKLDFNGHADFQHATSWNTIFLQPGVTAGSLLISRMPLTQSGSAKINLPANCNFGVLWKASPDLDFSGDVHYIFWSAYKDQTIELADHLPIAKFSARKDYNDKPAIRLGSCYRLSDSWMVRTGAVYDPSPVPDSTFDPQLPDGDRLGGSLGLGWRYGGLSVDIGYMYAHLFLRQKSNLVGYSDMNGDGVVTATDAAAQNALLGGQYPTGNGTYQGDTHIFGISLGFVF